MSAAQAKRQGRFSRNRKTKGHSTDQKADEPTPSGVQQNEPMPDSSPALSAPKPARRDLLLDGKAVRASYNMGCKERFVHVTAVATDAGDERHRFIVGARATELDRHGEWGAALSILDALAPLPERTYVLVSGDGGLCVEQHAKWLTVSSLFYLFRIKQNAGGIYDRVVDWGEWKCKRDPQGDLYEPWRISGSDIHSWRLWRLEGLRFASFSGITEGFVVKKKPAE